MPCRVRNPEDSNVSLPWPFKGILGPGGDIALDMTAAEFITKVGGTGAIGNLRVEDVGTQPAYDTVFENVAGTADLSFDGDIDAGGGYRQQVGPFSLAAIAAAQTAAALDYGAINGAAWVAQKPGSVLALSAQLDAAVTGAGESATARVAINGTPIAALDVAFTADGGEVKGQATQAKDTSAYVAGDLITVEYDSGAITNTPALTATIEVEQ